MASSGNPGISISGVRARAVNVPMRRPLVTGGGTVGTAPLVLVDLVTKNGPTGSAYVFTYGKWALKPVVELVERFGEMLAGDALAPYDIERKLRARALLIGAQGLVAIAMAAIDQAAWDAFARTRELPLARVLGASCKPIPAYNSCGLGLIGARKAGKEAAELLEGGFRAIKVRLGYPTLEEDLAVVRAVLKAVPKDVLVMSDYNQCLLPAEAIRRGRALESLGLYWIEEPVRFDDFAGHRAVRDELRTAVQTGENFWGSHDMRKALDAGAMDYVMPDASKIGGVSGWLRAAALADAASMPMSSHLFPEISAHLLAATPTAHYLEYVDWASPILKEPCIVRGGMAVASERPGIGLEWDEAAVRRHAA
ncbi:MAG: mandelate racemase [Alphaproteobacteria bacterium]|nr:mandelate racemase [Alphaproteobacteria bacterium]